MFAQVLFLCTGNYYRSRFAEELFNARARHSALAWHADSAGLARRCWTRNRGNLSQHAVVALAARGITVSAEPREPRDVTDDALLRAARVIALCEREHRPLVEARGPLVRPIEYWHVEDLPRTAPGEALDAIALEVERLIAELRAHPARSASTSASARAKSSLE